MQIEHMSISLQYTLW